MKSLSFLLFLISFNLLQAGNYIQIKYENTNVSYPPGTAFELFDSSGKLLYTQENMPEKYSFTTKHKLVLHPSWSDSAEVYNLWEGTILMRQSDYDSFDWNWRKKNKAYKRDAYTSTVRSNAVSATKVILPSLTKKDRYNLTLTFDNGLIFNYQDGSVQAFLDDEEVEVDGRYYISTEKGIYKISFAPTNGETWWVFNPKQQEDAEK